MLGWSLATSRLLPLRTSTQHPCSTYTPSLLQVSKRIAHLLSSFWAMDCASGHCSTMGGWANEGKQQRLDLHLLGTDPLPVKVFFYHWLPFVCFYLLFIRPLTVTSCSRQTPVPVSKASLRNPKAELSISDRGDCRHLFHPRLSWTFQIYWGTRNVPLR